LKYRLEQKPEDPPLSGASALPAGGQEQSESALIAGQSIGRLGDLEVRLANPDEVIRAQRLRFQVFGSKHPGDEDKATDQDRFDEACDHLIVLDHAVSARDASGRPPIVATYRLLPQDRINRTGCFYSQSEFDVSDLVQKKPELRFLELGRSCVLEAYRNKRTVELLWHGCWSYVRRNRFDVMFGCASFAGTDIAEHSQALSFLAQNAAATDEWLVKAQPGRGISTALLPAGSIDMKTAIRQLPPLIRGYMRLGAMFAPEAVVDKEFHSIDVLVIIPVANLNPRYVAYYGQNADRHGVQ